MSRALRETSRLAEESQNYETGEEQKWKNQGRAGAKYIRVGVSDVVASLRVRTDAAGRRTILASPILY